MLFRVVATLATAALALAGPLNPRQTTNNNQAIAGVIDTLSIAARNALFAIDQMQANQTASDGTVGDQINIMTTAFGDATTAFQAMPVSAGSTTVQPTNVELARNIGLLLENLATGLSGIQAQGTVPQFGAMLGQLDPTVASTLLSFNTTLPNSSAFVHIMMLDAHQFLVDEGAWTETLAALGF